jgi:hydroxyethylthiazole kinase-like uncharacterized protein yjeF
MLEENTPALWKSHIRVPGANSHKYTRGHAIVVGGGMASTGAARLAAISALRAGAGLVSVACTPESLPIYAAALTAVMTKPVKNISELVALLEDERVTATLIGPGCGISETTREQVLQILALKKPCVLDADALTAFKNDAKTLASAIHAPTILTPHEGEFARLFSLEGDRETRARAAAQQSNAVVVLKGAETIIAAPDGRAVINKNAPAWLATAGSGDVLSGIITGLLAQGMPAFAAACAGVWMHSRCAVIFGAGLIAEDLPDVMPCVVKELLPQ